MTSPTNPNSSPELTEVVAQALYECAQRENGNPSALPWAIVADGKTAGRWRAYATAAIQALSSKNELPSERLKAAYLNAAKERTAAHQAILSLQRRLDERDALLRRAKPLVGCHDGSPECLAVKREIDAALNPKDTGR
jgi:hypothetical protein